MFGFALLVDIHCVPGVSGLGQKYAFTKKSTISPDHYETLTKEGTNEDLILRKFRIDPVKIVDFLIKACF